MSIILNSHTESLNINSASNLNDANTATEVNGLFFLDAWKNGSFHGFDISKASVIEVIFKLSNSPFVKINENENSDDKEIIRDINEYRVTVTQHGREIRPLKWIRLEIGLGLLEMENLICRLNAYQYLQLTFEIINAFGKPELASPRYFFSTDNLALREEINNSRKDFFQEVLQLEIIAGNANTNTDLKKISTEIAHSLALFDIKNENIYDGFKALVFAIDNCRYMFLKWSEPKIAEEIRERVPFGKIEKYTSDSTEDQVYLINKYNNFIPYVNFFYLLNWGEDKYYSENQFPSHPRFSSSIDFSYILKKYRNTIYLSEHLSKNILRYAIGFSFISHEKVSSVYYELQDKSAFIKKLLGFNVLEKINLWKDIKKILLLLLYDALKITGLVVFFYFASSENWELTLLLTTICYGFSVTRYIVGNILEALALRPLKDKDRLITSHYSLLIDHLSEDEVSWGAVARHIDNLDALGVSINEQLRELVNYKKINKRATFSEF